MAWFVPEKPRDDTACSVECNVPTARPIQTPGIPRCCALQRERPIGAPTTQSSDEARKIVKVAPKSGY